MPSIQILYVSFLTLLAGTIVTAFLGSKKRLAGWFAFAFQLVASVGLFLVALSVLSGGTVASTKPLLTIPGLNAQLNLRIDSLSAIFILLVAIIGSCATLYSKEYMLRYQKNLGAYYPFLLLLFASIVGVVAVSDFFFFLVFWEIMSLVSYLLVIFEHEQKVNLRAGFKYFLMVHIGTMLIIIAAIILYQKTGSFSFSAFHQGMMSCLESNPSLLHLLLLFFFLGFATKAGVFPFGDWLPEAYSAAPSSGTAVFAGTMTKLGIYGLLRIFVEFLPISHFSLSWGGVIAVFGTLSLFVGSITALFQNDSKRLLAYSSVGQIGYILLTLGVGIAFLRIDPVIATIALLAGLFHLVNEAVFKSLFFLNSGSLLFTVGNRDLREMGGLAKVMPLTAFSSLFALASLSGLPPFGGFFSKWLIYQGAISAGVNMPLYLLLGALALFISVVSLAYGIKFVGSAFLGVSSFRDKLADVPISMKIPQGILGSLCLLLGLLPVIPLSLFYTATQELKLKEYLPKFSFLFGSDHFLVVLGVVDFRGGYYPPLIILTLFILLTLFLLFIFKSGASTRRTVSPWYCGEAHSSEETKYKAQGYYAPFREFFRLRLGPYSQEGIYPVWPKLKIKSPNRLKKTLEIDTWFYKPFVRIFSRLVEAFSRIHTGVPQFYLLWMVIGMILAIILMFALS
ncbi:MAG: proton-conducting transporter membrane subunit [Candidatus Edwardsbacteria bacterium]